MDGKYSIAGVKLTIQGVATTGSISFERSLGGLNHIYARAAGYTGKMSVPIDIPCNVGATGLSGCGYKVGSGVGFAGGATAGVNIRDDLGCGGAPMSARIGRCLRSSGCCFTCFVGARSTVECALSGIGDCLSSGCNVSTTVSAFDRIFNCRVDGVFGCFAAQYEGTHGCLKVVNQLGDLVRTGICLHRLQNLLGIMNDITRIASTSKDGRKGARKRLGNGDDIVNIPSRIYDCLDRISSRQRDLSDISNRSADSGCLSSGLAGRVGSRSTASASSGGDSFGSGRSSHLSGLSGSLGGGNGSFNTGGAPASNCSSEPGRVGSRCRSSYTPSRGSFSDRDGSIGTANCSGGGDGFGGPISGYGCVGGRLSGSYGSGFACISPAGYRRCRNRSIGSGRSSRFAASSGRNGDSFGGSDAACPTTSRDCYGNGTADSTAPSFLSCLSSRIGDRLSHGRISDGSNIGSGGRTTGHAGSCHGLRRSLRCGRRLRWRAAGIGHMPSRIRASLSGTCGHRRAGVAANRSGRAVSNFLHASSGARIRKLRYLAERSVGALAAARTGRR